MIYRAKSTTVVMIMKAKSTYGEEEPLMMKAEQLLVKRSDVACCCWWRGSRQLLMMGKKGDHYWHAIVDEDWRGNRELLRKLSPMLMKRKSQPWALMTRVKTRLITEVRKEKDWRLDHDHDRDRDHCCFCGCRLVNSRRGLGICSVKMSRWTDLFCTFMTGVKTLSRRVTMHLHSQ